MISNFQDIINLQKESHDTDDFPSGWELLHRNLDVYIDNLCDINDTERIPNVKDILDKLNIKVVPRQKEIELRLSILVEYLHKDRFLISYIEADDYNHVLGRWENLLNLSINSINNDSLFIKQRLDLENGYSVRSRLRKLMRIYPLKQLREGKWPRKEMYDYQRNEKMIRYIENGIGDFDEMLEYTLEMDFLYNYTEYPKYRFAKVIQDEIDWPMRDSFIVAHRYLENAKLKATRRFLLNRKNDPTLVPQSLLNRL